MQRPNSLPAKILKAKYFPNSSFWDASIGSSPSFVRRSIWEARSVLELGTRWRIGIGDSVLIWKDIWVPGMNLFKITSLPRELHELAMVK